MELTEGQKKFRNAWQAVLREASQLGCERGRNYGEMFAAQDMLLVDNSTALRAMLAIKLHRLATATDDAVVEDTLLDAIVYCAMSVVAMRQKGVDDA